MIAFSKASDSSRPSLSPVGEDAEAAGGEEVAQQLGREQRHVRQLVGAQGVGRPTTPSGGCTARTPGSGRGSASARYGRRPRAAMCAVHQVVATNRSFGLIATGASRSRANATSTLSKRPSSPRRPRPASRQSAGSERGRVDGHDPDPQALLGEPASEVELGDVAAEEVPEVDRRQQQVDPLGLVLADGQLERLDDATERQGAGVIDAREVLRDRVGRAGAGQLGVVGDPGDRAAAQPADRGDAAPPDQAMARMRSAPIVSGPAEPVRGAAGAPARRSRAVSARRRRTGGGRGAGPGRQPTGRTSEQQRRSEYAEPAEGRRSRRRGIRGPWRRSGAGKPSGLASRGRRDRLAASCPSSAAAVLDVVVERPVDVGDAAGGERAQPEPVVVVLGTGHGGKRQRELEQVAPEHRRGAGDGVRDQQRARSSCGCGSGGRSSRCRRSPCRRRATRRWSL